MTVGHFWRFLSKCDIRNGAETAREFFIAVIAVEVTSEFTDAHLNIYFRNDAETRFWKTRFRRRSGNVP